MFDHHRYKCDVLIKICVLPALFVPSDFSLSFVLDFLLWVSHGFSYDRSTKSEKKENSCLYYQNWHSLMPEKEWVGIKWTR